jgi:hypothetical protein
VQAINQVEKRIIGKNHRGFRKQDLPLVGMFGVCFQLELPYEQRCAHLEFAQFLEHKRIAQSQIFCTEHLFPVAGFKIKMLQNPAGFLPIL